MTRAVFKTHAGEYVAFTITGHSGFSGAGYDIVCSAISSMTELVINTITEFYGIKAEIEIDAKSATVSAVFDNMNDGKLAFAMNGLIKSFRSQLDSLANDYPRYVRVEDIQV